MPLLSARAAANPALLGGNSLAGGTRANYAVAVADHVGRGADTVWWVIQGRGRVTVWASEPAGIIVDARWNAINWVIARRRMFNDLN